MCGRNEYLSNFEAGGTLVETLKKKKKERNSHVHAGVLGNTTSDVSPLPCTQ
jgi:hypothetical protein